MDVPTNFPDRPPRNLLSSSTYDQLLTDPSQNPHPFDFPLELRSGLRRNQGRLCLANAARQGWGDPVEGSPDLRALCATFWHD